MLFQWATWKSPSHLPTRGMTELDGRRALQQNGAQWLNCAPVEFRNTSYFLTISAFSSMAIPPRSAILPLTVIVFPA
jgi:hypothetical protein